MADEKKKIDLSNYVTVAERIQKFYAAYPDGRIIASTPEIIALGNSTYLQVRASVLRSPDDRCPIVATAWEPYPGKTPYTKESEAMNAETSAVGRALALAGIEVQRDIASADEVQNREERGQREEAAEKAAAAVVGASLATPFYKAAEKVGADRATVDSWAVELADVATLAEVPRTHWSLMKDRLVVHSQEAKSAPAAPSSSGGDGAPAPSDSEGKAEAPASNESQVAPEGAPAGAELGARARKKAT